MNNKRKQQAEETKPLLENAEQPAEAAAPAAAPSPVPAEVVAPTTEAAAPTTETTVAMPEETKPNLSMTLFCVLGFFGALFDFFYAPCTSLGNHGSVKMSPYGVFLIVSAASFITVWPTA